MIFVSVGFLTVSIRAPAWGATAFATVVEITSPSFNSRSRVGSDELRAAVEDLQLVSIRAPAWGATRGRRSMPSMPPGFNSRSRVGSDCDCLRGRCSAEGFNSRSRVGSDNVGECKMQQKTSFNSRSRVGSDSSRFTPPHWYAVSIRAPAWGATRANIYTQTLQKVSIRAPAWGATQV